MVGRSVLRCLLAWVCFVVFWGGTTAAAADERPAVLVFDAASLTDVVDELGRDFTERAHVQVKSAPAASSTLAKQIEAGANADVFFSADLEWMDYLDQRKLLRPGSRHDVVRNRLVQKMEFLLQDTSSIAQPSDAEMAAWLAAHADRYRVPERLVFHQVYFSPSLRGDRAEGDARAMLASLGAAKGDPSGDPFMLAADPEPRSRADIAQDFGAGFAAALFAMPGGSWQGPVRSALGIGEEGLRELARNSFLAAFLEDDEALRERCLAEVAAYSFS